MSLIYATADDYDDQYGPPPANVTQLLASASRMVREATQTDAYFTDDTGLPTDVTLLGAFRDATLAQSAAWATLGINPAAGGVITSNVKTSKSLDGASVTFADAAQAAASRALAANQLVPEAVRILRDVGLASVRVWVYG